MRRWINLALKICVESKHSQRMSAVIVKSGRVLSSAVNDYGKHAEARAIRGRSYPGATIIVAREGKRMSKPCPRCHERIKAAGIEKIIWIDWSSEVKEERL